MKKAAGDDDISVALLQKCKSVILPTLCYLMNEGGIPTAVENG